MRPLELTGQKFGLLTVLSPVKTRERIKWKCRCVCGTETVVESNGLKSGKTQSCGCLKLELLSQRQRIHGMTGTPFHNIWKGMHDRCYNPNSSAYKNYGERGIIICVEWHEFVVFYNDMIDSFIDGWTIERADNNKGYNKENCLWIPREMQSQNRRPSSEWNFKSKSVNKS